MSGQRRFIQVTACLLVTALLLGTGCKLLEVASQVGTSVAVATGRMTPQQAQSVNRSTKAVGQAFESITPEQEYYIGRAVAASLMSSYKPCTDAKANDYVNTLGQTLAAASDKPQTFGGYHFLVLESDEINAFAAPGGLIFMSKGLLACCRNEDALAAVLAHEIGHVQQAHGLQSIKKGRLTSAVMTLAAESAKNLGTEQLAELTKAFEGTITDITSTLVTSGYARKYEVEADKTAIEIMTRLGYNPNGLKDMLEQMAAHIKPGEAGFAKTHPDPKDRIEAIQPLLSKHGPVDANAARDARFSLAMKAAGL